MPAELHISSLLVHARPDRAGGRCAPPWPRSTASRSTAPAPQGKIVVTLETASEGGIVERLAAIRELAGVLSAVLVFHQVEPLDQTEGG